jgi:hypothetical protein
MQRPYDVGHIAHECASWPLLAHASHAEHYPWPWQHTETSKILQTSRELALRPRDNWPSRFLHPALPSAQGHIHRAADAANHPSPSAPPSRINLHRYPSGALEERDASSCSHRDTVIQSRTCQNSVTSA